MFLFYSLGLKSKRKWVIWEGNNLEFSCFSIKIDYYWNLSEVFSINLLHRGRMRISSHICSIVICMEPCITLSYKEFTLWKRHSIFFMFLFYLSLPWILLLPEAASLQLWSCNAKQEDGNWGLHCTVSEMGRACCGGGKAIFLVAFGRWHMVLGTMLMHWNSWCITGTEFDLRNHVLCSAQGTMYSKSAARKRRNYTSSVFYIFT